MSNKYLFLIAVVAGIGAVGTYTGLAGNTDAQEARCAKQAQAATTISPTIHQGYRVYIDPATGKRTSPPPGAAAPRAVNAPPQPQPKVVNLGPGKGMAIDMSGHYYEMKATVDKHGHVTNHCVPVTHLPDDHSAGGMQ